MKWRNKKFMKTIQQWASDAVLVQNACNLSGVAISFAEFMKDLRQTYPNKGTDWYNRHPVAVLFSDKIASLTGTQMGDFLYFSKAGNYCQDLVDGKEIDY